MIAIALAAFEKYEVTNRVKLIEGPAAETMKTLHGQFDLIFIDADKPGYTTYFDIILEKGLLAKDGIILTDNSTYPPLHRISCFPIFRFNIFVWEVVSHGSFDEGVGG
jgi:predicted O-methyltransferase YrrM